MKIPSTTRIEAFSDGVMAIIITILVLELHVPQLAEQFTQQELMHALKELAPKLIAYAFSFLVIAIFWVNHHNFFHHLTHADAGLLWHNNHLLFWLSLIPLPTAFIGEHPFSHAANMGYAFVMLCAALSFTMMSRHAMYKGGLMTEAVDNQQKRALIRRSLVGPALYGCGLLAAIVYAPAAWLFFIAVPLYFFRPKHIQQQNKTT